MNINDHNKSLLPAITVFTGAFLLFLMQPLMGRTLLPFFGGSATVWMICLASWQTLLLAGYLYAHFFSRVPYDKRKRHVVLLSAATLLLFAVSVCRTEILSSVHGWQNGALGVFTGIMLFASFPFVLLAAGSTLVQAWLAHQRDDTDVYHLYAVSNAGSLCGLLCYPLLIEPFVPVRFQWFGMVALLTGYCLFFRKQLKVSFPDEMPMAADGSRERRCVQSWTWFFLPALSCFLLNAIIAHMFIDITPMPLIWVVFVACFLLSYIVGFSRAGRTFPGLWYFLAFVSLVAAALAQRSLGSGSFSINVAATLAVLFFCGAWLHSKLYENRPETALLTHYYLALTAGGAFGGLIASVVVPLLSDIVVEYPLALWLISLSLLFVPLSKSRFSGKYRYLFKTVLLVWALLSFVFIKSTARRTGSRVICAERNFYGVLRITQTQEKFDNNRCFPVNYLWNGQTTHGIQVKGPGMQTMAKAYYGETGGGIAVTAHPLYKAGKPMNVGVVGLGAGTMACYGRKGDLYRFYEINPAVTGVATDSRFFTFLADSKAAIDLIDGDARNMLSVEQAAGDPLYDSLIIDAYSGDSVPYHLATREAFELYFSRLKPDGILAIHISNWHINLLPLCKTIAKELHVELYGVAGLDENVYTHSSMWVFMTRNPMTWRYPMCDKVREVNWLLVRDMKLPKDDCGSLISLIRWN